MSAASDELYRSIHTNYLSTDSKWSQVNITYPGGQQLQSVVDEMVNDNFGGYNVNISFTIGENRYKCKVLPPQNKFSRSKKAYGSDSFEGAESYSNLMINAVRPFRNCLNMHILLRTLAAEKRAENKAAKKAVDDDGWKIA